jgi:tungstate transport system substrate-binding protein
MKRIALVLLVLGLLPRQVLAAEGAAGGEPPGNRVVRVAVIGGMTMTGLWQEIASKFEKKTGYEVVLVVTGPRPVLAQAMQAGKVDLLTMHSGDITTDLVADGYAVSMRPWTRNDLVIVGPTSDPAGIAGMEDGAQALKRIAEAKAPFLDREGNGAREMAHTLWRRAGVKPAGEWLLKDESSSHMDILRYAQEHGAYMIVGRMPVISGKLQSPDGIRILVDRDPTMRRPYVVMEANPARFPVANAAGAKALADYLCSEEIQSFLLRYGVDKYEGFEGAPLFYPVSAYRTEEAR